MTNGIEQVDGSEGVGGEGGDGVLVAGDDEGLGGQVEDDLGLMGGEKGLERGRVPHIPSLVHHTLPGPGQGKHIGVGGRFQAKTYHVSPQCLKP